MKLLLLDSWPGFTRESNPTAHELLRRRGQHAIFGPANLSGLWQPEDLYSNCACKKDMRACQALWSVHAGKEYRTKHGKLKSPCLTLHAKWHSEIVDRLKNKDESITRSFQWGGWSLPFDGSKDHLFLANRVRRDAVDDPGTRACPEQWRVQKVKHGPAMPPTDLSSAEALVSPTRSKPGPKTTPKGRSTATFTPALVEKLGADVAAARAQGDAPEPMQSWLSGLLAKWRVAARVRADACLQALPNGTVWEKIDWLENRYGGRADPSMDIRNHLESMAAAPASAEQDAVQGDDEGDGEAEEEATTDDEEGSPLLLQFDEAKEAPAEQAEAREQSAPGKRPRSPSGDESMAQPVRRGRDIRSFFSQSQRRADDEDAEDEVQEDVADVVDEGAAAQAARPRHDIRSFFSQSRGPAGADNDAEDETDGELAEESGSPVI